MADRKLLIAVIGGGRSTHRQAETAREVGRRIAEAGAVLICGGLGGTMEAASRGASEAGGQVIGLLPGTNKAAANKYVDLPLPTGMGEMRNCLIIRAADAVIALPGECGTKSEMAFARVFNKPLVSFGGPDIGEDLVRANSPEEAVAIALTLAGKPSE